MGRWNKVTSADTPAEFRSTWDAIRAPESTVTYIEREWMPYKEMFGTAWTKSCLHLGNATTSRVEGAHSVLKKTLRTSTGHLQTVCDKIFLTVDLQSNEIRKCVASETIRVPHNLRSKTIFSQLCGHISVYALNLMLEQYKKVVQSSEAHPLRQCTGTFRTTMGLPCSHIIKTHIMQGTSLGLEAIHEHWHLKKISPPEFQMPELPVEQTRHRVLDAVSGIRDIFDDLTSQQQSEIVDTLEQAAATIPIVVEDPVILQGRGRPQGALGHARNREDTSTTRDPSAFEYVNLGNSSIEGSAVGNSSTPGPSALVAHTRQPRRCGTCGALGHNRRSCGRQGPVA